jgi:hypothetical protein
MKKIFFLLVTGMILFSAYTTYTADPGITGIVEPADAVNKVTAIKENDSVSAVPINGKFALTLKTGNWTLVVEAINPYKNHVQTVLVLEGGPTDVGVIKLMK